MLFNSLEFLVFLPIVALVFFRLRHAKRWAWLLAASYFFYMWWKPAYAVLIFGSTVVDYFVALQMGATENPRLKKALLGLSLAVNLGLLFTFKYLGFFNDALTEGLAMAGIAWDAPELGLLLPVGISFYTFQTLSYTIDVYRGRLEPRRHFGTFALFVSFFPQLVAGPIERASRLIPQLEAEVRPDLQRFVEGGKRILWGLFKKVVVADRLAIYVDAVYADPGAHDGLTLILATYFFAFQIYADFSGYSDIAIGAARILGYDLMENFQRPYFARNISDFWRRWHISLSTWFRDYVYIPLGGNRVGALRWHVNLMIVFVVSGLWHGANWTFIVWGGLHGAYLITAILTANLRERIAGGLGIASRPRLHRAWEVCITFHLALVAWVFFRADSVGDAFAIFEGSLNGLGPHLSALFAGDVSTLHRALVMDVGVSALDFALSLAALACLHLHDWCREDWDIASRLGSHARLIRVLFYDLVFFAILLFGVFGAQQFIYFQF
jgi:D-alanyl-lipoteichoic acid acyltransferase DltB (MBOAT superfamily)